MDFFASPEGEEEAGRPLADRLRPSSLDDFVGQDHILGPGKLLRRLIEADCLETAIFYGPPGSGKTSLMKYIAGVTASHPVTLSAVDSNVRQVKEVIVLARHRLRNSGQRTLFFIDEFHRFNRAQQEVLLPHVEEGAIGFVGLTTYNPFFALAPALLSRTHLFEFKKLPPEAVLVILERALTDKKRGLGSESLVAVPAALDYLAAHCEGDGRRALRALEVAFLTTPRRSDEPVAVTPEVMMEALQKKTAPYDRDGDDHYDTISALIKSIRGSDPDAAVYWLARMLEAGDEPRFIARRLVIAASEDIGNADPAALTIAVGAAQAVETVGMPEARINLAQAVTYLASAPKSNASYQALEEAAQDIKSGNVQEIPAHLKDSHYAGAARLERGQGYLYPHDHPGGWVPQDYITVKKKYYRPAGRGYEGVILKRLEERGKTHES